LGARPPAMGPWFAKRFRIAEQKSFQFCGELFNAFNQVNLKPPASPREAGW
jgi:hypothetical protein